MNNETIFENETGLEIIGHSSVWNFHGINHLEGVADRKGSNLHNSLLDLKRNGHKGMVTLYATRLGRSQHSETQVTIYSGVTNSDNCSNYYSKRIGEVHLDSIK